MPEDRFARKRQPDWPRQETDPERSKTVVGDHGNNAQGTSPLGDQVARGWQEKGVPVFAWLVVVDGPDRSSIGTVHTLHFDSTTLGRVSGNRIVLHDETVSAQHARIQREAREGAEPAFALIDMGSRNGIYAGPRQSYRNVENRVHHYELKDGDYLLLGETTLVFKKL